MKILDKKIVFKTIKMLGYCLCRVCLLRDPIEGMIEGKVEEEEEDICNFFIRLMKINYTLRQKENSKIGMNGQDLT